MIFRSILTPEDAKHEHVGHRAHWGITSGLRRGLFEICQGFGSSRRVDNDVIGGDSGWTDDKGSSRDILCSFKFLPLQLFQLSSSSMMKTPKTFFKDYWPNTTLVDDAKAAAIEFVGTTVFLLLAFGGTQGSYEAAQGSDLERALYIATAFGLSLLVSAWFFFRATGGLFNPDVSLALLLLGCIGPVRFVLYCIAQLAGAVAAAGIVLALTPGPLAYKCVSGAAPVSRPSFDISFPLFLSFLCHFPQSVV